MDGEGPELGEPRCNVTCVGTISPAIGAATDEFGQQAPLRLDEASVDDITVPGNHNCGICGLQQGVECCRPVEGIGVTELRRCTFLDEVAGEHDAGIGDHHDKVVVGVAAAEVPELDAATADVQQLAVLHESVGHNERGVPDLLRDLGLSVLVVERGKSQTVVGTLGGDGRRAPHLPPH